MKRILIITLALILLCLSALAEINLIEFTESYTKRYTSVIQGENVMSILTGKIMDNTFNTSAGMVTVDEKYNVKSVLFNYNFANPIKEDTNSFLLLIAGISAIEYSGMSDSLLAISGKSPIKEALNLYEDNLENKIMSNLKSAVNGETVYLYSTEYKYTLVPLVGIDRKPTGAVSLKAEKIK